MPSVAPFHRNITRKHLFVLSAIRVVEGKKEILPKSAICYSANVAGAKRGMEGKVHIEAAKTSTNRTKSRIEYRAAFRQNRKNLICDWNWKKIYIFLVKQTITRSNWSLNQTHQNKIDAWVCMVLLTISIYLCWIPSTEYLTMYFVRSVYGITRNATQKWMYSPNHLVHILTA